MARILVVGYGEMGHAMEYLLAPAHELSVWSRHSAHDLATAAADAQFVFLCTPAPALAELAPRLRPGLDAGAWAVTMAKGLDDEGRLPARILAQAGLPRVAVMYGPMISEEIRAARPAWALLAAEPTAGAAAVGALFRATSLHLAPARDLAGVSWCAVLKNVYAMLMGAADALSLGDNARGWLLTTTVAEMGRAVERLGGDPACAHGLAGLGDLVTTGTSAGSHHRAAGAALVRGEEVAGEGVHALSVLRARGLIDDATCPLAALVAELLRVPAAAAERLRDYVAAGGRG